MFSDVLAVLFEELFCLKEEKKMFALGLHSGRPGRSSLALDIFEGILKVTFKANT